MAAQALRNYTFAAMYFASAWTIAAPAGMQVGDMMVAFCTGDSTVTGGGVTATSDWSLQFDSIYLPQQTGGRLQIWLKAADINDIQANKTYSWPTTHFSLAGGIFAITNARFAFAGYTFVNANTSNDAIIHASPITPNGYNTMMFWIAGGIYAGCDSRVPASVPAYFQSYNGGGASGAVYSVSAGTGSYSTGTTPASWTDGQIYNVHTAAFVALFALAPLLQPYETQNPLIYCGA